LIVNLYADHFHRARIQTENARYSVGELIEEIRAKSQTSSLSQAPEVRKGSSIYGSLLSISPQLANSYAQVKEDLGSNDRVSWAGTAHEIREILGTTLRLLAPDKLVKEQSWFKLESNVSGPTQKQRVRYVLQQRDAGSKEHEVLEQVAKLEDMIGSLVRAIYSRASDAAHRFKEKQEVLRIFRYFEVFAIDLLNIEL